MEAFQSIFARKKPNSKETCFTCVLCERHFITKCESVVHHKIQDKDLTVIVTVTVTVTVTWTVIVTMTVILCVTVTGRCVAVRLSRRLRVAAGGRACFGGRHGQHIDIPVCQRWRPYRG